MKMIINGKKYDTETAKMVGSYDNGYYGDYRYEEEELYLKKTGEFFLYGYGGALSKYASYYGDMRSEGRDITPLTLEEAKKWAMKHMDGDEYEEAFGPVEE